MTIAKILAFAGSTRKESLNKKLVRIAAAHARDAGAEVTELDLRDFPLPLFDQDDETADGLPANGRALKDHLVAHDGLLVSSPEYNSSISGVLKNTIDWISRPVKGEKELVAFEGKVVGLMSASPSWRGGLRGLVSVRSILGNIGCIVLPLQVTVSKAHEAFAPDGSLVDAKMDATVKKLAAAVVDTATRLK